MTKTIDQELSEIQVLLDCGDIDVVFNVEHALHCVVTGDGLDYGIYIISAQGDVIRSSEAGFSVGVCPCDALFYLNAHIAYPLLDLNEAANQLSLDKLAA